MIIDEIVDLMKYIEKMTHDLGDGLEKEDYYIEDMKCPHQLPSGLPEGYAAIYVFIYGTETTHECLKIGKVNAKSGPRFTSQHYGFNAPSTLAKSICSDLEFVEKGVTRDNVKSWMLQNLRRINIYIRADRGKAMTELVEAVFHYHFRPRYEGNI